MPDLIPSVIKGFSIFTKDEYGPDGHMPELFAEGQHPKYASFTCADSRSAPEIIFRLHSGEEFVFREGGPYIPPYDPENILSERIESHIALFLSKGVEHFLLVSHEDCAAAGNVACTHGKPEGYFQTVGQQFLAAAKARHPEAKDAELHRAVEREIVITGLENLMTYPMVEEAVKEGRLHLHGLTFSMGAGLLKKYYPEEKEFRTIAPDHRPFEDPHDSWDENAFYESLSLQAA